MLFSQFISRTMASIAIVTLIVSGLPANAQVSVLQNQNILQINNGAQIAAQATKESSRDHDGQSSGASAIWALDKDSVLACASCGCNELCAISAVETTTMKTKDPSLLTDSLWGNLILEMAYQRDTELKKIAKKLGIVNLATMGAIVTIAGATLAQSIDALATINPNDGHLDSIAPGIIGTSLSGATLLTFASRMYFGHKYTKQLKARQLAIKNNVEEILHHLEYSEAKCPDVRKELSVVIGDRASGELLQLWQSSHQLADAGTSHISMLKNNSVTGSLAVLH